MGSIIGDALTVIFCGLLILSGIEYFATGNTMYIGTTVITFILAALATFKTPNKRI